MARTKKLHKFYSSQPWITLRLSLIHLRIQRDGVLYCDHCRKRIKKQSDAIGHHKIELNDDNVDNPMVSLNPDEIEIICFDCHNQEHRRFGYKPEKKIYLVYGPPLSGKKSYVRQAMGRGDIVVDIDAIFQALTMLPMYDKPGNLLTNVMNVRSTLIDNLKTRYGKWHNAWIIGGYADKYQRDSIINQLGAEPIYIEATREECLERLMADEERGEDFKDYIDKWFDHYVE